MNVKNISSLTSKHGSDWKQGQIPKVNFKKSIDISVPKTCGFLVPCKCNIYEVKVGLSILMYYAPTCGSIIKSLLYDLQNLFVSILGLLFSTAYYAY